MRVPSGASETFDASANGSRVRLLRDVAGIDMDLGGIETVDLSTAAGNDTIVTGAGLALATFATGLGADVRVAGGEAHDEINLGTGDGDDTITTSIETTGAALITIASNLGDLIGLAVDLGADD